MPQTLLNKQDKKVVMDGLWDTNPITFQILGICSALAVTTQVKAALFMAFGLTFTTALSNVAISMMRNYIPPQIRIIVQLTVVSAMVIVIDQILKAYFFDISKQLSVFVGLIITNCIVMGRLEAFAMSNPPWRSFLDGLANGLGYSAILVVIGIIREIFGAGTILGFQVVPLGAYSQGYVNNGMMLLAPGAFFLLGIIVWIQRAVSGYSEKA